MSLAYHVPPHILFDYEPRLFATMVDVLEERAEATSSST